MLKPVEDLLSLLYPLELLRLLQELVDRHAALTEAPNDPA
jgi:hypothetical protein